MYNNIIYNVMYNNIIIIIFKEIFAVYSDKYTKRIHEFYVYLKYIVGCI